MARPLSATHLVYRHAPLVPSPKSCQAQLSRTGHFAFAASLQSKPLLTSPDKKVKTLHDLLNYCQPVTGRCRAGGISRIGTVPDQPQRTLSARAATILVSVAPAPTSSQGAGESSTTPRFEKGASP